MFVVCPGASAWQAATRSAGPIVSFDYRDSVGTAMTVSRASSPRTAVPGSYFIDRDDVFETRPVSADASRPHAEQKPGLGLAVKFPIISSKPGREYFTGPIFEWLGNG
jgi:hypothetical protein